MTYQSTILADNPVGFWPLNETSGTTATDLGSGGNNGTYVGSPTLGKTGLVFESSGVCPDFDRANDYVSQGLDTSFIQNTGVFTIEFWGKLSDHTLDAAQAIAGSDVGFSSRKAFAFFYENRSAVGSPKGLRLLLSNGSSVTCDVTASNAITDNDNHHIVVRGDGSKVWFTVDDVDHATTGSITGTSTGASSFATHLLASNDGGSPTWYWGGKGQYLAIYDKTLTPLQIRKHYQAGIAHGFHKEVLALNPEFYYPMFEGSGNPQDWSPNDRGSTLGSNITQGVTGGIGYDESTANTFAASHTTVEVNTLPSFSNTLTFGCLVKSTQNTTDKYLLDLNPTRLTLLWNSLTTGTLGIDSGGLDDFGAAPNDGEWHLVVFVCDGTTARAYVDGVQLGSDQTITAVDLSSVTDINIGGRYAATGAAAYEGDMQCAFLLSTAATGAQVRTLAQAARTLIESRGYPKVISNLTPSFYARLGEASGTTVFDESGNDNDGTINGSPVLATAAGPLHESRLKAMTFDGVDDFVDTGQSHSFIQNTGVFTICVWAKLDDYTQASGFAFCGNNGAAYTYKGFLFTYQNYAGVTNGIRLHIDGDSTGGPIINSSANGLITDNNWHFICVTGDSTNVRFYVDGVETLGSGTMDTLATGTSTRNTYLGTTRSNSGLIWPFDGDLSEILISDSTLTLQQIKQIYEAGKSRFAAEVISKQPRNLYRYNESSGNLIDYGALGNDGTWTGSPTYGVASPLVANEVTDKAIAVTASEEVAITSDIASNTYSFMMFAKPTAVTGTQKLFDDGGVDGFRLNGAKMSLFYSATEHDSDTTLVAGQAHLFGVSVDAGAVTFNLDGGADGTASGAPLINPDTLFDSSFAGDADEAAIFNTALTDADWLDIYEMASYSLTPFFGLQGNLSESIVANDFVVSAFDKATHALLGTATIDTVADPTGAYQIPMDEAQGAFYYTAQAEIGTEYVDGATYTVDDYVYPTDVESDSDPHFYQVTTGGTCAAEPIWNKAGGTSSSNGVVFQDMGPIPQPVTHGPLNPLSA